MVLRQTKDDRILMTIHVKPKSPRQELIFEDDLILLRVKATPVKGKANKEVIKQITELFGISKSDVGIIQGATATVKVLLLKNHSLEYLQDKLNAHKFERSD